MNLLSEHNRILRVGEGGTEVYLPGDNINITDHVISGKYWDNEINSAISSTSGYIVNEAFNQSTAWNEGQGYLTAHQDVSNLPYVQNSSLGYNGNLVSSISGKGLFAESANNSYHAESATSAGFVESANFANSALNSKSANFANSAWRAVFVDGGWEHDSKGNITAYNNSAFVGSTNGGKYKGILPIVVNNEEMKISAKSASLGVQEPLYFVEDSESATVIGIDNGAFPTFEGTTDGKISAINGSAINAVPAVDYSAGDNIDISNHVISVTGLDSLSSDIVNQTKTEITAVDYAVTANIANSANSATYDSLGRKIVDTYLTAHKDWTNTIQNASGNAYNSAVNWVVNQNYLTAVTGDYATKEDIESATQTLVPGSALNKSINDLYAFVNSNFVYYGNKPSDNVIEAYGNQLNSVNKIHGSDLCIDTGVFQVNGLITASPYGFTAVGVSAIQGTYDSGFSAHGVTAGVNTDLTIKGKSELLSSMNGYGFILSSVNTGIGSAVLTLATNSNIVSPKFEAKNISGAGFSIEASGAKGYDQNGNVTWDVNKPAKLIGWNNYQGTAIDSRASGIDGSIIASVLPDNIPTSYMLTAAPYAYMNGMGFFACYPDGTKLSVDTNSRNISVINTAQKYTASMNPGDISYSKYNAETSATDVWSLTGSLQKSEIEGDSATSAITAIAGSAIGGGGGQGVDYTGISPIVVNNVEHKISAQSALLGVQSPLYFVEDSESATVIGFSGSSDFPESADQACQVVTANSADWNACKTIVYNNSANWGDIPTKVVANSGLATGSDILYIVTGA